MTPISIKEVCSITRGVVRGPIEPRTCVTGAVIDSREAGAGSLFFALRGTSTHGVHYSAEAAQRGAIVVADRASAEKHGAPMVVVDNTIDALQALSAHVRTTSDALVVGITGSVGKTTTRRLLTSVLSTVSRGIQSPRNFNNQLGVPLSLLQIQKQTEFAVVELGASRPGEIAPLCALSQPEFGLVTRVAPAHLAGFGSLDAVTAAKQELIESLPANSIAFLNQDDPRVAAMSRAARGRVVSFGSARTSDQHCTIINETMERLFVRSSLGDFDVPVTGGHHVTSVAGVLAVAGELGLSRADIQQGFDQYEPAEGRMSVKTCGDITIIDDTYNASPASVTAAIRALSQWQPNGRRIAVLGDMLDLGEQAAELHHASGIVLAGAAIDHVIAYGDHADNVANAFLTAGGRLHQVSVFQDASTMLAVLDCLVDAGDVVLVKGSRDMKMEAIVEVLRRRSPGVSDAATEYRRAA